jgi:CDGSH-type Zn-finger protein/uncharacterized Fe-S cluster protein YjdI
MQQKLHAYEGREITVMYNLKRCVHAAECLAAAPDAFDSMAIPWIQPDNAAVDEVIDAVQRCPTGALHYALKSSAAGEAPDAENTIVPGANGPLYVRGTLRLVAEDGSEILRDTRMALCRCGASNNKPFCDNRHNAIRFRAGEELSEGWMARDPKVEGTEVLTIKPVKDGPLEIKGVMEVHDSAGRPLCAGSSAEFCRCGQSSAKPFCDATHQLVEFKS